MRPCSSCSCIGLICRRPGRLPRAGARPRRRRPRLRDRARAGRPLPRPARDRSSSRCARSRRSSRSAAFVLVGEALGAAARRDAEPRPPAERPAAARCRRRRAGRRGARRPPRLAARRHAGHRHGTELGCRGPRLADAAHRRPSGCRRRRWSPGRLLALLDTTDLPPLFAGLEPAPAPPVDLPADAEARALAQSALASTALITSHRLRRGPGGRQRLLRVSHRRRHERARRRRQGPTRPSRSGARCTRRRSWPSIRTPTWRCSTCPARSAPALQLSADGADAGHDRRGARLPRRRRPDGDAGRRDGRLPCRRTGHLRRGHRRSGASSR